MTTHGPALVAKAAQVVLDNFHSPDATHASWWIRPDEMARAVLNAVAADLQAGALEDAADECGAALSNEIGSGHTSTYSVRRWLREQAAEIRAGAS